MHSSSATSIASDVVSGEAECRPHSSFADSLTKRLGARAVVVTRWSESGERQVVLASDDVDHDASEQWIDSAEVAWRTGTPATSVNSDQKLVLQSRPLPRLDDFVITIASEISASRMADEGACQIAAAESNVVVLEEQLRQLREAPDCDSNEQNDRHDSQKPAVLTQHPSPLERTMTLLRGGLKRKLCIALLVFGLGCLPWPHAIRCNAVVEPASRRFVCVPFESRLESVMVAAGDTVVTGQLLARLDGSELRNELAALEAEYEQAQQRHRAALYQRDASKVEIQRLELERLEHEMQRVKRNQTRLDIRSPISGVVVEGDLEGIQGATLTIGQELFEIAPLDLMIVEVEIPESEVQSAQEGQHVAIYLDALGGHIESTIDRVHPRNELRDTSSVFVADVTTENDDREMRPGMRGTARVHVGYRTLAWIWLHKPMRTLRTALGVSLGW